ncbi:hypothetical protein MZO42_05100 [Sphingomonas psychrotolerans]|uniref:Secreted protein n=1 Tax=Sphingomonas psychrotolerans TaxID=1327635 RepID=A0ABU3N0J3_9SPHN|nr:hypothetical protein [Sphingomonas psychrotolerans]MDT8758067.1 hypothetical protein [Sphingomonas psychrotolerans]
MRMTLVSCVIACGLISPALAGERSGVSSRPVALAALIKDPAARQGAVSASDNSLPQRFMLPAGGARLERLPEAPLAGEARQASSSSAAWGPGSTLTEVTARAGGSYAVHDILRDQPRPRHRNSPLSAAFVLKLDGNDDSPAFSVGGGGVAAAVWQAVPK